MVLTQGFKILDALNIFKKDKHRTEGDKDTVFKRGLPLFMLTFDRTEKC